MFENESQGIACNFAASQELWNVPLRVYSMASCGRALSGESVSIAFHRSMTLVVDT